jgi:hypothetical protein
MKKVFIQLNKSVMMGYCYWLILSDDKKEALKADLQFSTGKGDYKEFDTLADAMTYAKEQGWHVTAHTSVSYHLQNRFLSVYIDEALSATYEDTKAKQVAGLLLEDYGI